jgi:hypothetical protein
MIQKKSPTKNNSRGGLIFMGGQSPQQNDTASFQQVNFSTCWPKNLVFGRSNLMPPHFKHNIYPKNMQTQPSLNTHKENPLKSLDDGELQSAANVWNFLPTQQFGAVCKSVVIANMLNALSQIHGYRTKTIHALKPEILAIFQTDEKKISVELNEPASIHDLFSKNKIRHAKRFSNITKWVKPKTVVEKFITNVKTLSSQDTGLIVPDVLKNHSVQGEILSKKMMLSAIHDITQQHFNKDLAAKIDAEFLTFDDEASFKKIITEGLLKKQAIAVFFNMHFPLKLAQVNDFSVQSVNPNPCPEFYEHVAMVKGIFQEDGVDKLIIHHFGRDFVENLTDVYASNQNLVPRQKEAYIKNPDYFNPSIKAKLKQQYHVKTHQELNAVLKSLILSGEIYDFKSKTHYLAYVYTREYFAHDHYKTHFEPWLQALQNDLPDQALDLFKSYHQTLFIQETTMPLSVDLGVLIDQKNNTSSEKVEYLDLAQKFQPDNSFKGSLLVCGLKV